MCGAILMGFFQVRQLRWRSLSSFLSSSLSKHCHHPHILHHHLQSIHDLLHPKHSSASLSPRSPRFVHAYSRITITNVIITFIVCKVCPRRSGARSLAYHLGFWDLLVRQLHHHSWLSQVYTMKLSNYLKHCFLATMLWSRQVLSSATESLSSSRFFSFSKYKFLFLKSKDIC